MGVEGFNEKNIGEFYGNRLSSNAYNAGTRLGIPAFYWQGSAVGDISFLEYMKNYAEERGWLGNDLTGEGQSFEYKGKFTVVVKARMKDIYVGYPFGIFGSSDLTKYRYNFKLWYGGWNKEIVFSYCPYVTYQYNFSQSMSIEEISKWHTFAFTYNWIDDRAILYVDGVKVVEDSLSNKYPMALNYLEEVMIGNYGVNDYWAGRQGFEVRYVQVYFDELSEEDILNVHVTEEWIEGKDGAFWHCDDLNFGNDKWRDRVHGFVMYRYNKPEVVSGKEGIVNGQLAFDGNNSYVVVNNPIHNKVFSIYVKFKVDTKLRSNDYIFDTRDDWYGSGGKGVCLVRRNMKDSYQFGIGDGTTNVYGNYIDVIDKFYDVVYVSDGNSVAYYENWEKKGSMDISAVSDDIFSSDKMVIGNNFEKTIKCNMHGLIEKFIVWDRPLSDGEIEKLRNETIPEEGLVLWLDSDSIDKENGIWKDKSGNGNDGVIDGAIANSDISIVEDENISMIRKWLYFDGVGDYVEIPSSSSLNPSSITVIALIRNLDYSKIYAWLFRKENAYEFEYRPADRYVHFNRWIGGVKLYNYTAHGTLPSSGDIFLAVTYDESWLIPKIYINGQLFEVYGSEQSGALDSSDDPILIGKVRYGDNWLNANVYFIAEYNRVMSDEEIKQMYDYVMNGKGEMITSGLVLWLDGDSIGDDDVWYDKSGKNNNGEIYGAKKVSMIGD